MPFSIRSTGSLERGPRRKMAMVMVYPVELWLSLNFPFRSRIIIQDEIGRVQWKSPKFASMITIPTFGGYPRVRLQLIDLGSGELLQRPVVQLGPDVEGKMIQFFLNFTRPMQTYL